MSPHYSVEQLTLNNARQVEVLPHVASELASSTACPLFNVLTLRLHVQVHVYSFCIASSLDNRIPTSAYALVFEQLSRNSITWDIALKFMWVLHESVCMWVYVSLFRRNLHHLCALLFNTITQQTSHAERLALRQVLFSCHACTRMYVCKTILICITYSVNNRIRKDLHMSTSFSLEQLSVVQSHTTLSAQLVPCVCMWVSRELHHLWQLLCMSALQYLI